MKHLLIPAAALLAAAAAILAPRVSAQSPPCFEPSLGQNLSLGSQGVSTGLQLGFTFPFPGTTGVTTIDVAADGYLWVGQGLGGIARCCGVSPQELLNDPPSIAPLWTNLTASVTGAGVYFNTLTNPRRAVITWDRVKEESGAVQFTVQCQLMEDGSVTFFYDQSTVLERYEAIVGMSRGNGAPDPGSRDLSASMPFTTGSDPSVYELFPAGAFDLTGRTLLLAPSGSGGFAVVDRASCRRANYRTYGVGCPRQPVVYELFPIGALDVAGTAIELRPNTYGGYRVLPSNQAWDAGWSVSLPISAMSVVPRLSLAFPFPYSNGLTTSVIDVAADGQIYLEPGRIPTSRCCPHLGSFLSNAASIAALWMDHDPNAGGGATLDARPDKAVITWDQLAEQGTTNTNTFQVQLFPDGRIVLVYRAVANVNHEALIGLSAGNGAADPGVVDYTRQLPYSTGPGGQPILMVASPISRPVLGQTFSLVVSPVPPGAVAAFLGIGLQRLAFDLRLIALPGCTLYQSGDVTLPFPLAGAVGRPAVPLPNDPALAGLSLYLQSMFVAPSLSVPGVLLSNGGEAQLGS